MSSNYEVLTASPEALGSFLASLPVANSPWDDYFSQTFCSSCEREDCDAICKEEAYQSFEEIGVGRRTAMRALEKAGAIRADKNSRRTKVIRLDGKCQRVIIVEMGGDP